MLARARIYGLCLLHILFNGEDMEISGKAKGGVARQASMTAEERSAAASKAAKAKSELGKLPQATHFGTLNIGDIGIPCAVLENGTRILSESGIADALLGTRSGASKRLKKQAEEAGALIPVFMAPGMLKPFISNDLIDGPLKPVEYNSNGKRSVGYEATILPSACDVWLKAREAGALQKQQLDKAQKAEVLMRGLAHVGIIALVDEATGFQKDRAKDALAQILEAFVAKELQPWVKTFDAEFYEGMFRLRGLPYPPEQPSFKPQYFGKLTNDIVYRRLAPGVLDALKDEAKKAEKKGKLHQHLTAGHGRQSLLKHLGKVVALMSVSDTWDDFIVKLDKVSPRLGDTLQLDI